MPLGPGSRLDAYELVSPLGAGGMGEVWLATEVRLGRKVALKLLPADLTQDPARVGRFEQEARAASALSHPNVCTILALGQSADGQHYIAMEYVEGQTLRKRLTAPHLTIRESLDIAIQIASALTAAHASGIVHRDIKPENVILRPDGFVKVLDFGLAKLVLTSDVVEAQSTRTAFKTDVGHVVGTIAYMSPEQVRAQEVDGRTDLWSLGVLLYEMVAGRSPFAGQSSSDVLAAILDRDPAPLTRFEPIAPPELQRIVTKALRKERAQRYQTMLDFLLDVEALREELHVRVRSGSGTVEQRGSGNGEREEPKRAPRFTARRATWIGVVTLALLACVVVGWWRFWSPAHSEPPGPTTPVQGTLTRLTFGPGLQTDATFSPDGRFIAYASDKAGHFNIWVQPVAGGAPVQVTRSSADDVQPDWSADGSTIAFRSERDGGGLFLVSALGGAERRLTRFGFRPKFAPYDQSLILFSSTDSPRGAFTAQKLYLVRTDGSEPHALTNKLFESLSGIVAWGWYPRGEQICVSAVMRDRHTWRGFFVPVNGGTPVAIQQNATAFNGTGDFVWNSRGDVVFFENEEENGIGNVWKARYDTDRALWRDVARATSDPGTDWRIALSRDGSKLAFTSRSQEVRLRLYGFDPSGGQVTSEGVPFTEPGLTITGMGFSRDGSRVVYTVQPIGDPQQETRIQRVTPDDPFRVLFRDQYRRVGLAWSRDGEWVAYNRMRPVTDRWQFELVRSRVEGGDEQVVRGPSVLEYPWPSDWSPDDLFILGGLLKKNPDGSMVAGGSAVLWPVSPAAGSPPDPRVLVADETHLLMELQYSPDNAWLTVGAFVESAEPAHVGVVEAGGGRWRMIGRADEWAGHARWSPDGKALYFLSNRETGALNVWRVYFDPATGRVSGPFQVTRFTGIRTGIAAEGSIPEMFVGASRLVLPIKETTGSVWMLDNVDK